MTGGDNSHSITHVIFDMDGLLLDTERFYSVVQEKILSRYGKKFEWSLKAKMMGKKALEAGQILVKELGLEGVTTPEEFIAERETMLEVMFPDTELMPGAERLIRHLYANGVPMAVATSSHKHHFELKTTKHGELFGLMHHVVVGDDPAVTKGKPAPDIFLTAFDRFQEPSLKTENVLVFEDAPTGVGAAIAAQMPVVMVPDSNLDKSLQQGANQILSSLLEFDPTFWGLPAFKA
ncbi:pseudouridine 5'-phosphatase [Marchantia polymorpha subsp. ruderalis]|uniref:glycerol-1-phosphatase n=2 Tax=Marchantia polymorpha TaxID=3197 RepID=A0A176W5C1_MARPO|nr:hypothetical protein AXG93_4492s1150 [Marchantia polymorpha subsp. ruderalis]PTQ38680.1 hypothetical protein MARPO_0050s0123 [Marchantia polymorpha]BBN05467.1 hypothetical protein Mp_3g13310 [Marchantia polymorpha subsp. ruderalis]|eukprot:PTQ38680.1 hypothetical protein MARPO_0050s0123 [Marchantia polymorpha]